MIKIVATQSKDRVLDIQINDLEENLRTTLMVGDGAKTIAIMGDSVHAVRIDEESTPHVPINALIAQLNRASFIISGIKMKIKEKGFIWSEMRLKCEITIAWSSPNYVIDYRRTGMLEGQTDHMPDTTEHALFQRVNEILFW